MPNDYKKEWIEKSAIDYFSPFISLWLACNSWYMSHYSDLSDVHPGVRTASDRAFINKLKEDTSGRNHLYLKYVDLITTGQAHLTRNKGLFRALAQFFTRLLSGLFNINH